MQCPKCQHENPPQSKFCFECGVGLELTCPKCGISLPTGVKFCNECGHDLSEPEPPSQTPSPEPSAPTGERRQATVLFSDLSGYTAMNERLDPEEVQEFVARIKAEAVRIVEFHGGTVTQFVGDEVLALFGIPTAHEDDPVRALRAALELHELVRGMSGEVEGRIEQPLRLHTGVDTGLVVTSTRDVRDGEIGVTGDTVNTAARLVGLASPDDIMVSPDTRRFIAPFFETEEMEAAVLKGKVKPVIPHRIVSKRAVESRFEAAEQRGFTPFTGRAEELTALHDALERAKRGEGQLVTVVGEAGLGKSRLLYEFRHSLIRDEVSVLEGRCQSYGAHTPYLPFIDALRRGLRIGDIDDAEQAVETAAATVREIDPGLEEKIPIYLNLLSIRSNAYPLPEGMRRETLRIAYEESLAALFVQSSHQRPIVWLMEDWQWADQASDSALRYLLSVIADHPVVVVVAYRPEYTDPWGIAGNQTALQLRPLEENHCSIISRAALQAERLPEGLVEAIHERTGGNPFFIEEMCTDLLEQGTVLVKDGQAALTRPPDKLALPGTVEAVIRSRVDRLDEDAREILRLASVIGREFGRRILERVLATSIAPTLEALKNHDLVRQVRVHPEAEYIFKHVLTQVVVYETLLLNRRRELHGLVGNVIEELYADRLEEQYEALAHHYQHAADAEKAVHYLELAGRKAARNHSFPEANRHYEEAVALLDSMEATPERRRGRADLVLRWANAATAGKPPTVLEALKRSLADARELADSVLVVRLSRHLGSFQVVHGDMSAFATLEECLGTAERLGDEARVAMATDSMGRAMWHAGRNNEAVTWLGRSVPLLEGLGNMMDQSFSLAYMAIAHTHGGEFKEAGRCGRKSLELAETLKHPGCNLFAHSCLGWIEMNRGNWERGEAEAGCAIEPARRFGYIVQYAEGIALLGLAAYRQGDEAQGLARIVEGIGYLEPVGSTTWMPFLPLWYGRLAQFNAAMGRWTEANSFMEKCMALDFEWNMGRVGCEWARAWMAARQKRPDWREAEAHADAALSLAEQLGLRPEVAIGRLDYARLLGEKGALAQAREQVDKAAALFGEMEMNGWLEQAETLGKSLDVG